MSWIPANICDRQRRHDPRRGCSTSIAHRPESWRRARRRKGHGQPWRARREGIHAAARGTDPRTGDGSACANISQERVRCRQQSTLRARWTPRRGAERFRLDNHANEVRRRQLAVLGDSRRPLPSEAIEKLHGCDWKETVVALGHELAVPPAFNGTEGPTTQRNGRRSPGSALRAGASSPEWHGLKRQSLRKADLAPTKRLRAVMKSVRTSLRSTVRRSPRLSSRQRSRETEAELSMIYDRRGGIEPHRRMREAQGKLRSPGREGPAVTASTVRGIPPL